jgi:hydrogenase-1 operon protein HyaE
MRSPLIQALVDDHHYELLNETNIDDFLDRHDEVVLFFTENPQRFPESNDVAVILPQLIKQFGGRITAAVVDGEAEQKLQGRYGFTTWPALVLLRRGEYLGVITGMQDWPVFVREVEALLAAAPVKPPAFAVPVMVESGDSRH